MLQRLEDSTPAVSVIIPNFNHSAFLKERIDSVLSQTFKDFELIIVDDASTDGSVKIIEQFLRVDNRISFYPSDKNSGSPFVQWNRGVAVAKADLIWIAESDDVASPVFLQQLVELHRTNSRIALAYSQSNRMNERGEITGNWQSFTDPLDRQIFKNDFVMNGMAFIQDFLIHKNVIPNASAVVFKKRVYEAVSGANEKLRTNSDWLTWLKMLLNNEVAFVAAPLNNFRFHAGSVIAQLDNQAAKHYREQYDYTMRRAFEDYCQETHATVPREVLQANRQYKAYDFGGKGIFEIRKGNYLKGLVHLVQASLFPRPTLGYIRRAFKSTALF